MARASTRRELFLQVSGTVDPLKQNLKAGSAALVAFAGDAERQLEAVEQSLRDLAGSNPQAAAKQLTDSYSGAFREIRRNAEAVLSADSGAGAVQIINANAARQAATAAENRAAAMRVVADAARAEAVAQSSANVHVTQYAAAAIVAAREAEDYANALRAQANTLTAVEGRMGAIVPVGKRVTEMSGQARAGMQQLSYQLGDVATQFAAGTPPSIIFAQQVGQVTQALGLMSGGAKGWLSIIGGPWGIGISSAMVVLTPLVAKMFENNDALEKGVDKLKKDAEQTRISDQARQIFTRTIEGQIEAQRKLNQEIERGMKSQRQLDDQELRVAFQRLEAAEKSLKLNQEKLGPAEERVRKIRENRPAADDFHSQPGYEALIVPAERAVSDLKKAIANSQKLIAEARRGIGQARIKLAQRDASELSDEAKGIEAKYQIQVDAANAAADKIANAGRNVDREALARKLANIETAKQKDLKALQEREQAEKRATNSTRSRTKQEVFADFERELGARGIKRAAGRTGLRSAADQNEIFRAGESNLDGYKKVSRHQTHQALDPTRASHNDQKAREAAQAAGLKGFRIVTESGGRKHYEWTGAAKRGDADVASSERAMRAEQSEEVSYVNEARQAKKRLLDALGNTADTEEARFQLSLEEINAEADARVERFNLLEQQGRLTKTQADVLRKATEATRGALVDDAYQRRMQKAAEAGEQAVEAVAEIWQQRRELAGDELRGQIAALRLQEGLAVTTSDRHRLALEILALEQKARRQAIENIRDNAKDKAERDRASAELTRLPEIEGLEREQTERQFASPFARYRDELVSATGDMNAALEGVAARGFGALEDAGAREIQNWLKLEGVVGDVISGIIADLGRLALQKGFLALLDVLGLGGGSLGGSVKSGLSSAKLGFGGARAGGGPVDPSNYYLVGERGPELFIPGASGAILPNRLPSAPTLAAPSSAGNGFLRVQLALTGEIDARIDQRAAGVAVEVVRAAAPEIQQGAVSQTIDSLGRRRL